MSSKQDTWGPQHHPSYRRKLPEEVVVLLRDEYDTRLVAFIESKGLMNDCEIEQRLWELRGEIGPRQEAFELYAEKHGEDEAVAKTNGLDDEIKEVGD